jgi:hypothetical protein
MGCLHNTQPSQLLKGPGPYRPFGPWPKETRDSPLSLPVAHRPNPAITDDEMRQRVVGEEAWTKGDSIRGFAQRKDHRRSHSTAACVNGEEAPVRGRRSGRGDRRSGQGGAPWQCGTCGRVDGVEEQPEEATASGVLTEEDDGEETPIALLR